MILTFLISPWIGLDAELAAVPALRGVVLRCNVLHYVRRCCTALQRVDVETDRTPHADALFGPADRALHPRQARTRHTFPHRPMPVLALACANTNVCGDCRLRCSAPPTSEG